MGTPKVDWNKLKQDYKYGKIESVRDFLDNLGTKMNGNVSRLTKGWREERDNYREQLERTTQEKTTKLVSDTEAQVRARQAQTTKELQTKAKDYLDQNEFRNPSEATRALEISLREERKALGIDRDQLEIGYEPAFMKTRFAQQLKDASWDELIVILQEFKRLDEQKPKTT